MIRLIRCYKIEDNYLVGFLVVLKTVQKKSPFMDTSWPTIKWDNEIHSVGIFLGGRFLLYFLYTRFITINDIVIRFWSKNLCFYLILADKSNFSFVSWINPFLASCLYMQTADDSILLLKAHRITGDSWTPSIGWLRLNWCAAQREGTLQPWGSVLCRVFSWQPNN